ncbi:MAG: DHH family phosphoesterase [Oscillospiraceae bacterium]|nr:DHH family phosphoesterase [Oscillospiraceae bacterium]
MKIEIKEAVEFLRSQDDYLILMHASPDGDTLGCGFSLCGALQRMGKRAKAVCPDEIPHRFDYMREAVTEQEFEERNIICVDVADTKLLGDMKEMGDRAALCIDHHVSNTEYAERLLLRENYAAAAELMYEVITALGVEIDRPIANCIYTGVATDTGCFKFSNTTPQTHIIAAKLMECGAEIAPINYAMFELKTPGRLKLEQEVLKGISFHAEGHVAVITVMKSVVDSIPDIDSDDVGAMAALPRQIEGVDIGISIKEKKGGIFKASLRSSERIDVSEIAKQFGGGGHARAAGCSFSTTFEEAERLIVEASCAAVRQAGLI